MRQSKRTVRRGWTPWRQDPPPNPGGITPPSSTGTPPPPTPSPTSTSSSTPSNPWYSTYMSKVPWFRIGLLALGAYLIYALVSKEQKPGSFNLVPWGGVAVHPPDVPPTPAQPTPSPALASKVVLGFPLPRWKQLPILPSTPSAVYEREYSIEEGTVLTDLGLSLCEGGLITVSRANLAPGDDALVHRALIKLHPSDRGTSFYLTGLDAYCSLTSSDDSLTLVPYPGSPLGKAQLQFSFTPRKDKVCSWIHLERVLETANIVPDEEAALPDAVDAAGRPDPRPTHLKVATIPVHLAGFSPLKVAIDVQVREPDPAGQPPPPTELAQLRLSRSFPLEVVLVDDKNVVEHFPLESYRVTIPEAKLTAEMYDLYIPPWVGKRWRVGIRFCH